MVAPLGFEKGRRKDGVNEIEMDHVKDWEKAEMTVDEKSLAELLGCSMA